MSVAKGRATYLGSTFSLALFLAAAASIINTEQAYAQDSGTPPPVATDGAQPPAPGPIEKVVVTGSRLKKNEFTSSSPIQVITTEESTLEGLADTADILQSSSVAAGSQQINNTFGAFVTPGGQGANTISLRGLGAQRTLLLINGKRLAPAGSRGQLGSPDLNTLPKSMIERFEILKDGGSSVYGSDAVAGVINVITRKNYEGLALSSNVNATFDGGGETFQLDGIWGSTFDRGNITVAAEYYKRNALTLADRDYLNCAQDLVTDASGRSSLGLGSTLDIIDPKTGKSQCLNTFVNVLIRTTGGTYYINSTAVGGGGIGGLDLPGLHRVGTSWNRMARSPIANPAPAGCLVPFAHACSSEELYALMTPAQRAAVEAAWRASQAELDQNDPRDLARLWSRPSNAGRFSFKALTTFRAASRPTRKCCTQGVVRSRLGGSNFSRYWLSVIRRIHLSALKRSPPNPQLT